MAFHFCRFDPRCHLHFNTVEQSHIDMHVDLSTAAETYRFVGGAR